MLSQNQLAQVYVDIQGIYGNTVALISSKRENYGLIIESEEYAAHQGMLFEAVWMASERA